VFVAEWPWATLKQSQQMQKGREIMHWVHFKEHGHEVWFMSQMLMWLQKHMNSAKSMGCLEVCFVSFGTFMCGKNV
jgi:hypothetical protein